jgi:uncharacterized membrane protein
MKNSVFVNIIRWAARIIGALLIIFCLTFFIGSRADSQNPLETYNIVAFSILGIGLAALILAWWKEGLGGIISFLSFIVWNLLAAFSPVEGAGYGFILLFPLVPSVLHLLAWWLKRNMLKKESQ